MNRILVALLAGVIYSLTGWAKNAKELDPRKRDFNWTKFAKNIVIGLCLGVIACLFPDMPLDEITALPLFTVIQMFVDKLFTKRILS